MDKYHFSYKNFIDLILFVPVLLVLTTVFAVDRELMNGVVSGKHFWFYASMGLISLTTPLTSLKQKQSVRFVVSDLIVILFVGSVLTSALLLNHSESTTKLIILALLVVLYFLFRIKLGQYKHAEKLISFTVIVTGLVEAIWGLRQLYGFETSNHSLFNITGSFFNPGPYAGFLSIIFPLALWESLRFLETEEQIRKTILKTLKGAIQYLSGLISILTIVFILLVVPAAMSRASWIAIIAGSLCVLLIDYTGKMDVKIFIRNHRKKTAIISLSVAILLAGLFTGMYFLKKNSADGRALIWKVSTQAILKHPFGVGLGHFSGAYGDAQAAYFESGAGTETEQLVAGVTEYGFNEYLQILIESGILSLGLFLTMMGIGLFNAFRRKKTGALGALVALMTFSFFSYPFSVLPFTILLVFLLASCNTPDIHEQSSYHKPLYLGIAGLLVVAFCLKNRYPTYAAYKVWKDVHMCYESDIDGEVMTECAKLYPYLNDQIIFLFEYAQSLSKTKQYAKSNQVLQRAMQISCDPMLYNIAGKNHQALKEYNQAEACFIKASNLVPNRLYPYFLLAKFYEETKQYKKARETASLLLKKEPKVPSTAVKDMKREMESIVSN
ncbi:MAG: O-antigen ligase family protein [Bacteroidales bacterium]|nr:O-antigen ligase family protein [Bacteroidales bacterium]